MRAGAVDLDDVDKLVPCRRILEVLHADAAILLVDLGNHGPDKTSEDVELLVFSFKCTLRKTNKRRPSGILEKGQCLA